MTKFLLVIAMLLSTVNLQTDKILFVGDSMTSYKGGWHHQLANKLGKDYHNVSLPGKRTDWMRSQLTETLNRDSNFSSCFIYGGINDAFSFAKPETVLNNVQDVVDLCNSYGIEPVVIVGYDPKKVMIKYTSGKNSLQPQRNRYIEIQQLYATKLKNCKVIPVAIDIERSDSDDGVHFKPSGHRKFAEWVYENYIK